MKGAITLAVLAALPAHALRAAAVTDGSMGAVQTLSGAFTVTQSLGQLRGTNLFHSFKTFSVAAGESATFTTEATGLRHVITRVTGGEASLINGPLRLQAGAGATPEFWFANPSGVIVGTGGSFNLPAGLHLSTAHRITFSDNQMLLTGSAGGSSLTVAAPQSFGFLTGAPVTALSWQGGGVSLAPRSTLQLTAGGIQLVGTRLTTRGATLALQGPGEVRLEQGAQAAALSDNAGRSGRVVVEAGSLLLAGAGANGAPSLLQAESKAGDSGGGVSIKLRGAMELRAGALVFARSESNTAAGSIEIDAASLRLTGSAQVADIVTENHGTGSGGATHIVLSGALDISGGDVRANAYASGRAGDTHIRAGSVRVEAQGGTGTIRSTGFNTTSGAINIDSVGALDLLNGASIGSFNDGAGAPGAVSLAARDITLAGSTGAARPSVYTIGNGAGAAADIGVAAGDSLRLSGGAQIESEARGSGPAGWVRVSAPALALNGDNAERSSYIRSISRAGSSAGGGVDVAVGTLDLTGRAFVATASGSALASSPVSVKADRVVLDGRGRQAALPGIYSFAFGSEGSPGAVTVTVSGDLVIRDGAMINTQSLAEGEPGSVSVKARTLLVDGSGAGGNLTGIGGDTRQEGSGGAPIDVTASRIDLRAGGVISSATFGARDAGRVRVVADALNIDGSGSTSSAGVRASTSAAGAGGLISIEAGELHLGNGGKVSNNTAGSGAGGTTRITAGQLRVDTGGRIESSTTGSGDAGFVQIDVKNTLTLNGTGTNTNTSTDTGVIGTSSGSGKSGLISISAGSVELKNAAVIRNTTERSGEGGFVLIEAGAVRLSSAAGISSNARGSGDAGFVGLKVADDLVIESGGFIATNALGSGAAGIVSVQARDVLITGRGASATTQSRILSTAFADSSGNTGILQIDARGDFSLRDGGLVSIDNAAKTAQPNGKASGILVTARNIGVSGARISAAAFESADANLISLEARERVTLADSTVSTSARNGSGGPITIDAGSVVTLRNAQVTTSVTGSAGGDGGFIRIGGSALVMASGFVQANTAAARASGGSVVITTPLIVPDGSNVFIGGDRIAQVRSGVPGYNVIQAVAPDGVSGNLDVTIPTIDLGTSLAALTTNQIDFGLLGRDVCQIGFDSSFTPLGRGALPPAASAPLKVRP